MVLFLVKIVNMKKLIIKDQNKVELSNLGKQRALLLKDQNKEVKQNSKAILNQINKDDNEGNLKFLYW